MLSSPKCLFWSPNKILVSFAPGLVLKGSKLKQVGFRVGCEMPVSSTGPGMYVGPDRNKGWRRYFPRVLLRDYHPGCFRLDQSPSSLLWESAPLIHSPKMCLSRSFHGKEHCLFRYEWPQDQSGDSCFKGSQTTHGPISCNDDLAHKDGLN